MEQSVLIIMATYNGGKYLRQQIESIINQTHKNWTLLVRDDGSNDETKQVLSDYEKRELRIKVYHNTMDKHGAYLNFWTLIHEARAYYSDYEYYFFSDQDDIWEKDKIEVMITEAKQHDISKPLLLYGDMRVIDQNDKVIYESINDVMGIGKMRGYSLLFTHGFLWGCDICVNNALFTTMPLLPLEHRHIDIMSHDNYMGKFALLEGEIKYINKVMINHRRHGGNTTDKYEMKLNVCKVIKRAVTGLKSLSIVHARVYNQTLVFIECCKNNNINLCNSTEIEKAIRSGGIYGCLYMMKNSVMREQKARTIGIYSVMLLGIYKKWLFKDV